jgi:hypothetical protein
MRKRPVDRRRTSRPRSSNRRHDERVALNCFVNRFINGQPYMCRMVDISRTGVRLVSVIEPHAGRAPSHTGLQFQLPDRSDVLTASGEVITREGRAVGIRFTNLPPDAAWAIESFLSYSLPTGP